MPSSSEIGAIVVWPLFYLYISLCVYLIAKKVGEPTAWYAWVPIMNMVLICQMGETSPWWVIACFVPYVGGLVALVLMLNLPRALGIDDATRFLAVVPVVNLVYIGYLALRKEQLPGKPNPLI